MNKARTERKYEDDRDVLDRVKNEVPDNQIRALLSK